MLVKKASYDDISSMIEICHLNLVSTNSENFSAQDFAKKGFLITSLTHENARKMIDDEKSFIAVAQENDEILGYLTAYEIKQNNIDFPAEIAEIFNKKTVYYKQIAKKPGAKNVGNALVSWLANQAKLQGYEQIICRIVNQPLYNQKSVSFHEKQGFKQISSIKQTNQLGEAVLGVYLKTL